jgi:hypothetical protein
MDRQNAYLFSYFVNNGEDGLRLAWSRDGYCWEVLANGSSYLIPMVGESQLMRDPFLMRAPDGVFHLVWTTSWRGRTIGHACSRDLMHWSEQRAIPLMPREPDVLNCWAPEVIYDQASNEFLILWSSTVPGRFPETDGLGDEGLNHRIYAATTKDWKEFSEPWVFYDGGFDVIDATVTHDGELFRMIVKDETTTPLKKHLRCAVSQQLMGPYVEVGLPFTRHWVEGPAVLWLGDHWLIYYDEYTRGRYGAVRTRDFVEFDEVSEELVMPAGVRHGSVLEVSLDLIQELQSLAIRDGFSADLG